jgi:hypothetical protein
MTILINLAIGVLILAVAAMVLGIGIKLIKESNKSNNEPKQ